MRNVGFHRETVTVKTTAKASDGAGGFTISTTSVSLKAQVEPFRGMRGQQAGQTQVSNLYEIKFIKRSEVVITAKTILEWNGKTLTVQSFHEDKNVPPTMVTILAATNQ